ncbi:MAG: hypothetical protein IJ790_01395 [Lachnospiraceae bacterium]|nr:hypothetical protein [Lachnospiraceae bacterium]
MKNKKLLTIATIGALAVSSIASNMITFAAGTNNTQNEVPAKPENEVIGKITAISANSITVTLAEMKAPSEDGQNQGNMPPKDGEGRGNMPPKDGAKRATPPEIKRDGQMPPEQRENIERNLDDMFTLTSTSKTYNISNAKFDEFMRHDDSSSDENTKTKTYSDYKVGDYVMIELESSTSTVAKSVRSANMAMHGGMGPKGGLQNRPQDGNQNAQ